MKPRRTARHHLQRLGRSASRDEHGKRIGPEAPRYLPWLLDGLDESRTASVLRNIPEPLRQAYRDEWLPAFAGADRWGQTARRR